jgi:hypothetical protein
LTREETWASAIAAGVPDHLFWRLTPVELGSLLGKMAEVHEAEERAAVLRAGLVAATVHNVHRRKGTRAAKPSDYLKKPPAILDPSQMEAEMDAWAKASNKVHDA